MNGSKEEKKVDNGVEHPLETEDLEIEEVGGGFLFVEENLKKKENKGNCYTPLGENGVVGLECLWLEESDTSES